MEDLKEVKQYDVNIPYRKVAKQALIKWNGLTEEEADKKVKECSFEELEKKVGAKDSMESAIESVKKNLYEKRLLHKQDEEIIGLEDYVFNGKNCKVEKTIYDYEKEDYWSAEWATEDSVYLDFKKLIRRKNGAKLSLRK